MIVITVPAAAVAQEMKGPNPPFLIDVREAHEWAFCHVEGAVHIPLGSLSQRVDEIPRDRPVVLMCHHGGRSSKATEYLMSQGFDQVRNLEGGIEAWALNVDKAMPRY